MPAGRKSSKQSAVDAPLNSDRLDALVIDVSDLVGSATMSNNRIEHVRQP